ncbi:MAG: PhoU domain-containing protein [Bdellovibrionales bacterium]
MFFPFIQYGAKVISYLIRPSDSDKEFGVKYLDRSAFENSTVALSYVEREILRMGDIVSSMVESSIELFKNQDEELEERIVERDNRVDLLFREIQSFLAEVNENFDSVSNKRLLNLMMFASDLESAADVIDNSIMELARKKHGLKLQFSDQGWREIKGLHDEVCRVVNMSLSCFQTGDLQLANRIIESKKHIRKMEKEFKKSHLNRYLEGNPDTIKTSTIHLDALNEYRRIVGLVTNHIYSLRKSAMKRLKSEADRNSGGSLS